MNRTVARPGNHRPPPHPQPGRATSPEAVAASALPPHPDGLGSILCLAGLAITALFLQGKTPENVARFGAYGVLLSLSISFIMDVWRGGVRNLVRSDFMALMALYFLTLAEFLVSQGQFNTLAAMQPTRIATQACIWAYAGLVIGRHLVKPTGKNPFQAVFLQPVPSSVLFWIFWACFFIGYFNMLLSVNFNVVQLVDYFMQPRFFQPWQRGKEGDWHAMLYETSMILYLIPPLGGILLARRRHYPWFQVLLVVPALLFTLFYGFSSGTRNIFLSYLVTFVIGYCFSASARQKKEIIILGLCSAVAVVVSTKLMLDFRVVGLKEYIAEGHHEGESNTQEGQTIAVDNNLYAISRMVEYFPDHHAYTGLEPLYLALIHPIPRVLWPSKPTGASISAEDVFGADGWTIALSVVGEEYIMHGCFAVFVMSILFGACCGWWNLLASPKNTEFGILIYSSGFFSIVITMRSMMWISAALLPTLAGLILGWLFLVHQRRKQALISGPPARPRLAAKPQG